MAVRRLRTSWAAASAPSAAPSVSRFRALRVRLLAIAPHQQLLCPMLLTGHELPQSSLPLRRASSSASRELQVQRPEPRDSRMRRMRRQAGLTKPDYHRTDALFAF